MFESLSLDPVVWPAEDPYHDPEVFRAHERFWWHEEIAAELRRMEQLGFAASCVKGIAGNIRRDPYDVAKNLRMMLGWGEVERAEALHDFEPDTWVRLVRKDS